VQIKDSDIRAIIESAANYFDTLAGAKPEFGVPYNLDTKSQKHPLLDFSGHIGLTGTRKGGLVITCQRKLVESMVITILGGPVTNDDDVIPMIAEMANTVAGNLTKFYGAGFDISVPTVVIGEPEEFKFLLAEPTLVIPFTWQGSTGNLIVGLS